MSSSLRLAFICGAAPMVLGSLVFFTWLETGWGWWQRAWLWTIAAGLIFLVIGAAGVTRHLLRRGDGTPRGRLYPALAIVLLVMNLPLGVLYMWVVVQVASRYAVEVVNESRQSIESLVVSGAGLRVELGPVPSGGQIRKYLALEQEGKLEFAARQGADEHRGLLDRSVAPASGGQKRIWIGPDGVWQVLPGAGGWAP